MGLTLKEVKIDIKRMYSEVLNIFNSAFTETAKKKGGKPNNKKKPGNYNFWRLGLMSSRGK